MRKYRDLPMDLADAGLVGEREPLRRIFTLDRRDFQVYRPSRIGRFISFPLDRDFHRIHFDVSGILETWKFTSVV